MKLEATRKGYSYSIGDESGYRFEVDAVHDPEFGWSATVTMGAHGFKTAEDAVRHLKHSAEAFLRQLKGLGDEP